MGFTKNWINGQWLAAESGNLGESFNPATGEALGNEIENGGYKESGIGRLHGVEGLGEFMQTKHISWTTKAQ